MTPTLSAALLLVNVLLVILYNESDVIMTPLRTALLLVKVLLVILSDVRNVHMTPQQVAALLAISKSTADNNK